MKELSRVQVAELISNLLDKGIDLEDLAETSGVSQAIIILIMKGQLRPSPIIRTALIEALGIRSELLV